MSKGWTQTKGHWQTESDLSLEVSRTGTLPETLP